MWILQHSPEDLAKSGWTLASSSGRVPSSVCYCEINFPILPIKRGMRTAIHCPRRLQTSTHVLAGLKEVKQGFGRGQEYRFVSFRPFSDLLGEGPSLHRTRPLALNCRVSLRCCVLHARRHCGGGLTSVVRTLLRALGNQKLSILLAPMGSCSPTAHARSDTDTTTDTADTAATP